MFVSWWNGMRRCVVDIQGGTKNNNRKKKKLTSAEFIFVLC